MDYRDRNDSRYDRNEGRFSGREESDWQDQSNRGSREWDREVRDWDRAGQQDYTRAQGRDYPRQSHELRSQGRGFRDAEYGRGQYEGRLSQREPSYAQGPYSGPTGSYSGYRDDDRGPRYQDEDWGHSRAQEGYSGSRADYGQSSFGTQSAGQGNYGRSNYGQSNYGQSNYGPGSYGQSSYGQGSYSSGYGAQRYGSGGAEQSWPQSGYGSGGRSYENEGGRGAYRGRQDDSFGQQLRDTGSAMMRSVKRVFRGPKGYKRSDERIREDVNDRLAQQDQVDPSEIEVQVQNGEVTLTGTVQSRHEKFLAEEIADDVGGVHDVHNQLRVRRQNESQSARASTANSVGSSVGSSDGNPTQSESSSRVRNGHV